VKVIPHYGTCNIIVTTPTTRWNINNMNNIKGNGNGGALTMRIKQQCDKPPMHQLQGNGHGHGGNISS